MKNLLSLYLVTFVCMAQVSAKDQLVRYTYDQALSNYAELTDDLRSVFSGPVACKSVSKDGIKKNCSFKNFCQVLEKNKNSPYIYENENGYKIPNFHLSEIERSVRLCFVDSKDYLQGFKRPKDNENNFESKRNKEIQRTRTELLDEVIKQKLQIEFMNFEQSIKKLVLENEELDIGVDDSPEVAIKKEISISEDAIGFKFPKIIRDKYLKSVMSVFLEPRDFALPKFSSKENVTANQNPHLIHTLNFDIEKTGSEDRVLDNQELMKEGFERMSNLFEETQDNILEILEIKMKKDPTNKAQYENMIKRVSTIRYQNPPITPREMFQACPMANAFYNDMYHTYTICPQVMEMPDASIKSMIAHEVAHSIDPCLMAQTLRKVSDYKYNANTKGYMNNIQGDYYRWLNIGNKVDFENEQEKLADFYTVDYDNAAEQNLSRAMDKHKLEIVAEPIPFSQNVMGPIINCLSGDSSVKARESDKELALKSLNESINRMYNSGATMNNRKYQHLLTTKNNFEEIFAKNGACSFLPGRSQLQEAFSDWLSTEVLAKDVEEVDGKEKLEKSFESMAFQLAMSCETDPPDIQKKANDFKVRMGCIRPELSEGDQIGLINEAQSVNQDIHNPNIERAEKIILAHPMIRKALGCSENKELVHCE